MQFDHLEQFAAWYLQNACVIGNVPLLNAVHRIERVLSVTMYRHPPFQVQMFVCEPGVIIPEHTHPNVDSIEVYVGGQIRFSHLGKWLISGDNLTNPAEDGTARSRGFIQRVKPDELHGGVIGDAGGVFLSIQHWLNGVDPHCVAADYSGPTMGGHHMAQVKFGEPVLKDALTASDAAHKEFGAPGPMPGPDEVQGAK